MNKEDVSSRLRTLSSAKTFWIAYSGGADSHALLHSLSDYPASIKAIHVHHGLNPKADQWATHCHQVCQSLNLPLTVEKIQFDVPPKSNIEALAREKRYEIFARIVGDNEALLTGHHQEDQAETFLLQLFRGAGIKGLSAMPEKISFANGMLIRPLLHFSRSMIYEYARSHQLTWVDDDSNNNLQFYRNVIRHQLAPQIQIHWPAFSKTLARSAEHMASAQHLLEELATQDLSDIQNENLTLSIPKLLAHSRQRQHNVLRYWLNQRNFPLPSTQILLSIEQNLLHSKKDATPLVTWSNVEIRRYRNELYAINKKKREITTKSYEWNLKENIKIEGILKPLSKEDLIAQGIDLSGIQTLSIRFRGGGERCHLTGHTHSKQLKKIFQERGIPPWERYSTPLIYHENQIIAVLSNHQSPKNKY